MHVFANAQGTFFQVLRFFTSCYNALTSTP